MATIILEDIPAGSQLGIDLHNWQTGPNFRGARDVTPGLHCLHMTIHGVTTTKYAVWLNLHHGDCVGYTWDKKTELLVNSQDSAKIVENGLFLVAFPSDPDRDWTSLISNLTPALISGIVPFGVVVTSITSSSTDRTETALKELSSESEQVDDEPMFLFLTIDMKRSWPMGAIGREVTEMARDKSWLLGDVLRRIDGATNLLGQFQFCFICVLLFTSITAFDQWHLLLKLFCSSKTAMLERSDLYASFLIALQAQMQQVPADLYEDIFSLTLPRHLQILTQHIADLEEDHAARVDKDIQENLEILIASLHREFGYAEEEHAQQQATYPIDEYEDGSTVIHGNDEDDEAPVIVDL